jgi:hypothetical protein
MTINLEFEFEPVNFGPHRANVDVLVYDDDTLRGRLRGRLVIHDDELKVRGLSPLVVAGTTDEKIWNLIDPNDRYMLPDRVLVAFADWQLQAQPDALR